MLNYIPFYTHIWSDKKFKKLPDNDSKILFIYLFGNPQVTLTGIYSLDLEICQVIIKTIRPFNEVFADIIKSKLIEWDEENEKIFIINRFKLIPTKSPQVAVGAINELNKIKHPFKDRFIEIYKEDKEFARHMWRLDGQKITEKDILTEDFIKDGAKFHPNRKSLKEFIWRVDKNIPEQKLDEIIFRVLPNLKPL